MSTPTGRTIGPVADLERHLPPEWWRSLFNSFYLKTDGDVVENDGNTAADVDLLIQVAGLGRTDRILDLCCGQGRHCLELARRGFEHVTGMDRSRYLIRLARKRAKSENLHVSFHEGDARRPRLRQPAFDCVALMGNSFGYFDHPDDDAAVLQAVRRALVGGGRVVLDVSDGEWMKHHFERRSWEWIDQSQFVCRERSLADDQRRLISREVVVHAERGVLVDQFYAERLYTKDELRALLERVGFGDVEEHGPIATGSDRNQDLGMMAHRLLFTARAPAQAARAARTAPPFPDVTVLLGDPRLPDALKRDGTFNPEDLDTVRRLKEALAELTDYTFRYLDDHTTLAADLERERPSFVLNLCDEGLKNDAYKELHVPAMLEALDIPYSGAAPAALAMCYDKGLVRAVAESIDVPVPLETYVAVDDQAAMLPSVFPAIVKPNCGDASLGITQHAVVHSSEELVDYLDRLRRELPGRALLVQEFLTGTEYSIGIVGNPGLTLTPLPPLEVDYSGLDPNLPRILGYESKWIPDSPYWSQIRYHEATLDEEVRRRLTDHATRLFERLGCRDYARFDFRTDGNGEIKLLEVNPNPGWCWDGKLNFMAANGGLSYGQLLRLIVEAAQERVASSRVAATDRSASRAANG